jgi:hypothetical protein
MSGYRTRRSRPVNKLPVINENSEYNHGYNNITNAFLKKGKGSPVYRYLVAVAREDVKTINETLKDPRVQQFINENPHLSKKTIDILMRDMIPKKLTVKMRKTRKARR